MSAPDLSALDDALDALGGHASDVAPLLETRPRDLHEVDEALEALANGAALHAGEPATPVQEPAPDPAFEAAMASEPAAEPEPPPDPDMQVELAEADLDPFAADPETPPDEALPFESPPMDTSRSEEIVALFTPAAEEEPAAEPLEPVPATTTEVRVASEIGREETRPDAPYPEDLVPEVDRAEDAAAPAMSEPPPSLELELDAMAPEPQPPPSQPPPSQPPPPAPLAPVAEPAPPAASQPPPESELHAEASPDAAESLFPAAAPAGAAPTAPPAAASDEAGVEVAELEEFEILELDDDAVELLIDEDAALDLGASTGPPPAVPPPTSTPPAVEPDAPAPHGGNEAIDALLSDLGSFPPDEGGEVALESDGGVDISVFDGFSDVDEDQDSMTGVLRPEDLALVRSRSIPPGEQAASDSVAGGELSPAMRQSMADMGVEPGDFEDMTSISSSPPGLDVADARPAEAEAATSEAETPEDGDDPDDDDDAAKKKGFFKKLFG